MLRRLVRYTAVLSTIITKMLIIMVKRNFKTVSVTMVIMVIRTAAVTIIMKIVMIIVMMKMMTTICVMVPGKC